MWWLATTVESLATAIVLFELGADGEHGSAGRNGERHRLGRVSPRPAQELQTAVPGASDGVVAADVDRAVVAEDPVDHRPEPGDRIGVVVGDRLVGQVAAGEHERAPDTDDEEVVQGAVREQQPQLGKPRGDQVGDRRTGSTRHEHDRSPGRRERRLGAVVEDGELAGGREVGDEHGERLVVACLAAAELADGRGAGRVAGEVEPPDALDGDDLAGAQ